MNKPVTVMIFCAVITGYCSPAFPAGEVSETGTTGMSFLRVIPSAHIAALGGGLTAYPANASAVWSNPALLALSDGRSVQFTHTEWIEDIAQEYAAISSKQSYGSLGLAVQLFDSGDIDGRDSYGSATGPYSIKNVAVSMSYSRMITGNIAIGFTYKRLFEKISMETASGYAIDMGIAIQTPVEGLSLAASARNYGRMGKLKNERTKLPSDVCFGGLYRGIMPGIERPYILLGDFLKPKYSDSGIRLGLEIEAIERFALRMGYRTDSDIEDISFGLGFSLENFTADVSFTPLKEGFDNALRFTFGLTGF
ncbi:PorV/PorQ family protein [Candidatus Latescibacterota bacterium]